MNYYNEFDPHAAAWLRELIKAGLIPDGHVDERSIVEVQPIDLIEYTQCHFFAGIGGWSLALQLAGVDATRPLWTGSCPCQPFSAAGKQLGTADERHLWPAFFNLIRECRPVQVFGEQVASAIGHGWLDGISTDLAGEGYACGAAVLGAHSVGAPHIRQRLYWVADTQGRRRRGRADEPWWEADQRTASGWRGESSDGRLADGNGITCGQGRAVNRGWYSGGNAEPRGGLGGSGNDSWLSDAESQRYEWRQGATKQARGFVSKPGSGIWGDHWVACADGKARRIEPGLTPLANGIPARVVRLRGYGNAIVPQVAAEFISTFYEEKEQ